MAKMSREEEAAFVARAMKGDEAAFQKLISDNVKTIRAILHIFLTRVAKVEDESAVTEDTEDLVKEVFLKAFVRMQYFDSQKAGFSIWLATIARNVALDHLRKKGLLDKFVSIAEAELKVSRGAAASERIHVVFDGDLSASQITAALAALADYFRACGGLGFHIDFDGIEVSVREAALV
jgi:RNA polymerase sigma factor (sigma-70 family)